MIFALFVVALISFTGGQVFRLSVGNGLVIQLTDVMVFVAVFSWLGQELYYKRLLRHFGHEYTKPILFFVATGFLSLVFNSSWLSWQQLFVSSLYLFRWIVYALLFFEIKSLPQEKKRKIIPLFVVMMVLIILVGYLQYIFYPNLRNLYYLGWDEHLYRLFSTMLDPNFAAAIFSLFLFLLLGLLFRGGALAKKQRTGIMVLFGFTFIAFLLTYSRGGFLTFTAGSIILLVLLRKYIYLSGLLAALVIGILIIPKDLRSSGVELWRTASIFARTDAATQAIKIFADHPIIGVGFDTYRYAQKKYHFAADTNWEISHSGGGTDSSLLFILATTGIAGLITYLFVWWKIVQRAYKIYKKDTKNRYLAAVILSATGALFVNSLFINSLFYPFVLFWMWTFLGIVDTSYEK